MSIPTTKSQPKQLQGLTDSNWSGFASIYIHSTASVRYNTPPSLRRRDRFPNTQSTYHTTLAVFLWQSTPLRRQFPSASFSSFITYWFSCQRVLGQCNTCDSNLKVSSFSVCSGRISWVSVACDRVLSITVLQANSILTWLHECRALRHSWIMCATLSGVQIDC